ncbi:nitric oxide reductase FlRd-NAD(+) reductase [Methylomagnum ishizawai]|uniref:Nitric oxide reductase FlRd-NAD(+) reductase n=1 Tax=Methylomagnum ishizawai TaxID=1760988 RepID=A0A1Y6D1J4_9GAMM|nr:FAD-dependent oxidoreductase [Methylomagnum ishizawai]SMF96481.1 nitric oxide reductase FlRd-NAD(+) reductase [Methylomagnum ishizawai]
MHTLIIGSGMAGITFAEELKKHSPDSAITVLTQETHGYYSRPMLSHGFSRDDVETKIILKSFEDLRKAGIEILTPVEALAVDRAAKTVRCRRAGEEFSLGYDKLVLATGSDALVPPPFRAFGDFRVVNSLDDLIGLRRERAAILTRGETPRWAVVGGGLIGCEAGSDLAKAGDAVTLFHALPRLMERQLVEADSATLLQVLTGMGIEVRLDAAVQGFERDGAHYAVKLADGSEGGFHGIVVACGFKPRTALAQAAGLPVNRGIRVDAFLRTLDPDIHALGDAVECADGRIYAYVMPIRQQALWLAQYLAGKTAEPWLPPTFKPRAKVHGFTAAHPYLF